MILKHGLSIVFFISAVYDGPPNRSGHSTFSCSEPDCDEWKDWNPTTFDRQQINGLLRDKVHDESASKLLERIKSKRVQDHLRSDLGFESVRNNAELSRTLLQQFIQNVQRSHEFPPRYNRADSKENYHLQASYIPRLG